MPKTNLESAKHSKEDITDQARITPDDKLRAAETWRRVAPQKFKDILDATKK
jgi:hypothetical protein